MKIDASARQRVVYALIDPRSLLIRYVGKSVHTGSERLKQHLKHAADGDGSHRSNWIRQLNASGLAPEVDVLETGEWSLDQVNVREMYWIDCLRNSPLANLTNMTDGGDGAGWVMTEEQNRARLAKTAEWQRSPEGREQRRLIMLTRYESDKERRKIGEQFKAHWEDPDKRSAHTESIRAVWSGNDELKARISEISKTRWNDDEYRERVSSTLKNQWNDTDLRQRHVDGVNRALDKAKQRQVGCLQCSFVGNPMAKGAHRRWTGHFEFIAIAPDEEV